jgi:uncharacterized membrane protein SirB2
MSLKGFHIIFIALAVLCSFGFYGWTLWETSAARKMGVVEFGQGSAVVGTLLLIYGIWFVLKKYQTIIV